MLGETGDAWVGTMEGLYFIPGEGVVGEKVEGLPREVITGLAVRWREGEREEGREEGKEMGEKFDVAVGMERRLWRLMETGRWHFWRNSTNIDGATRVLSFVGEEGVLLIGNKNNINVQLGDLTFWNFGEYEVPYPKGVTSFGSFLKGEGVVGGGGEGEGRGIWVGTEWGLMRYNREDKENGESNHGWRYFNGGRWLPTSQESSPVRSRVHVVCALGGGGEAVLVGTDYGVARVEMERWSLEEKAERMQELVYPQHDRFFLGGERECCCCFLLFVCLFVFGHYYFIITNQSLPTTPPTPQTTTLDMVKHPVVLSHLLEIDILIPLPPLTMMACGQICI